MIFKIFLYILSALSYTLSQQMLCFYISTQCSLFIYNPDGLNQSVLIRGNHLPSNTDVNITAVTADAGITKNIPPSICTQFKNVEMLYFQRMNIEVVSLTGCTKAKVINLSYNSIKELPSDLCKTQPLIATIYLSFNKIQVIPLDALKSCSQLQTLNMDNNQLSEIPPALFALKPALKTVTFEGNKNLKTLQEYTFNGADNLDILILKNCSINYIAPTAFAALSKLTSLDISYNSLTSLNPEWFKNLVSLTALYVNNNPLITIPPNTFRTLTSIQRLYLSSCGVTSLDPVWFSTLTNLKLLDLSTNNISEIPPGLLSNSNLILQINFSYNKLKRIDSKAFSAPGLQNLNSIEVSGNQISAVDQLLLSTPISLNKLSFLGNVCENRDIMQFYKNKDLNMGYFQTCFLNFAAQ